jgi:TP901 family phage tail tape measure protein
MSTIGEMLVVLGVDTAPLTAGMAKAKGEMSGFADSTKASSSAVGVAGLAIVGAVAAIGTASVMQAAKFQTSMTTMANNANLPARAVTAISKAIQTAAIGTDSSANTMAAALAPVAGELARLQGGALTAASATQILTAAQNLHEGANIDLATSLKSITDLLLVYHLKTSDAASVSDSLFRAQAQLGISGDTLASMMQRLQPRIAGSGVSLNQLLGIVRELEPVVGTGSRAVMTVGTVLQRLLSPSATAGKALAALGVHLTDATGKFVGMPAAIDRINAALAHLPPTTAAGSKEISKATLLYDLFGQQANVGAQLLKNGAAGITANTDALGKYQTAAQAAEKNSATLGDQVETLKAGVSTLLTAIGGALLPVLQRFTSAMMPILAGVEQWIVANPQLTAVILGMAGAIGLLMASAMILPPILGAIGIAVGIITSPILLVGAAFVALALIISRVPAIMRPLGDLFSTIGASIGIVAPYMERLVGSIMALVQGKGSIDQVGAAFGKLVDAIGFVVPGIMSRLGQLAHAFIAWIGPIIPKVLSALGQLALQLVGWIGSQAPGWASQLLKWAQAFVAWISPMIGRAIGMLAALAQKIIAWVLAQAPGFVTQFLKWVDAFVGWIGPMIVKVLDALAPMAVKVLNWLVNFGMQFTTWFITNLVPDTIVAVLNVANAILSWIVPHIPDVIGVLVQMLGGMLDWFGSVVGQVGQAAGKLGQGIVDGILNAIAGLPKLVGDQLNKIPGIGLLGGIVGNVVGGAGDVLRAIPHLAAGGMVTSPTLAIVGEAGPEAVVPLAGLSLQPKGGVSVPTTAQMALTAQQGLVTSMSGSLKLNTAEAAVSRAQGGITSAERSISAAREAEARAKTVSARDAASRALASAEQRLSTAHQTLALAEERLALARQQEALAADKSAASATRASGSRSTGSVASGSTALTAALTAFTAALVRAVQSGVPITLDAQAVGSMLDSGMYASAARVSSGFVTVGGPNG